MNRYISIILISIVLLVQSQKVNAQVMGLQTSSYLGLNGFDFNPSNILCNSRFEFMLATADAYFSNNYFRVDKQQLVPWKGVEGNTRLERLGYFRERYLSSTEKKNSNFFSSANLRLSSFTINFGRAGAIGFHFDIKAVGQIKHLPKEAVEFIFSPNAYVSKQITISDEVQLSSIFWKEIGFAYAFKIDKKKHSWKIGINPKLQFPVKNVFLNYNGGSILLQEAETFTLQNGNLSYFHSENIDKHLLSELLTNFSRPSFDLNIGLVYKIRRSHNSPQIDNDYSFKIGIALSNWTTRFSIAQNVGLSTPIDNAFFNLSDQTITSFNDIDKVIADATVPFEDKSILIYPNGLIKVFADLQIKKNIYLNLTSQISILRTVDLVNSFPLVNPTYLSITPRWETKWFGVFLPINWYHFAKTHNDYDVGIAFKIGPLQAAINGFDILSRNSIKDVKLSGGISIVVPISKKSEDKIEKLEEDLRKARRKKTDTVQITKIDTIEIELLRIDTIENVRLDTIEVLRIDTVENVGTDTMEKIKVIYKERKSTKTLDFPELTFLPSNVIPSKQQIGMIETIKELIQSNAGMKRIEIFADFGKKNSEMLEDARTRASKIEQLLEKVKDKIEIATKLGEGNASIVKLKLIIK